MIHAGTVDLEGGQLQKAKMHVYSSLPTFVVGQDEARIVYVSAGGDLGYWLGASDGAAAWHRLPITTVLTQYGVTGQVIADAATYSGNLSGSPSAAQKALIVKVQLSSTLAAGNVTVTIYNDVGRTTQVYSRIFDLAALATDVIPAFFESDVANGVMYIDVTNNAGSVGAFNLTVTVAGVILVQPPAPPGAGSGVSAGVAGQGIDYDAINAWLDVDLAANGGLEFDAIAGAGKLRVKTDPAGGITRVAAGVQLDSTVVRTTGSQDIAGLKRFTVSGVAVTPAVAGGAPAAGTWLTGSIYVDLNNVFWYCTAGGVPGTWEQFHGLYHKIGGAVTGSYTGTVALGGTLDVALTSPIPMGRRGIFRYFNVWASKPIFAASDQSIAYRIDCFPNENLEGRARLWRVSGNAKMTYMAAIAGAGSATLTVNSTVNTTADDLVRLHQVAGPLEEYARVTGLLGGPPRLSLDELTANALAINDIVSVVNQSTNLSWQNDSAVVANYEKIYLRFYNDGASDLIFGYEFKMDMLRGGAL